MICFVTFYSHFDAIRMRRRLEDLGIGAVLMPVPRDLSSSCGTCLRFETDLLLPDFLSEGTEEALAELIGNRSYLSGLPVDDPRNTAVSFLLPPKKEERTKKA